MNEMVVDDEKLISTTKASELSGYSKDYVGQLCREEKIECRRMSGHWYIDGDSLKEYQTEGSVITSKESEDKEADKTKKPTFGIKVGNVRDDTFSYDGVEYIATSRAADLTGYSQDYVGQMARNGEIKARKVGRRWFVGKEALVEHKKHNDGLLASVQAHASGVRESNPTAAIEEDTQATSVAVNQVREVEPGDINFNVRYSAETDKPLVPKMPVSKTVNPGYSSDDISENFENKTVTTMRSEVTPLMHANNLPDPVIKTPRNISPVPRKANNEVIFTPIEPHRKRNFPWRTITVLAILIATPLAFIFFFGVPKSLPSLPKVNLDSLYQKNLVKTFNESYGDLLPGKKVKYSSE